MLQRKYRQASQSWLDITITNLESIGALISSMRGAKVIVSTFDGNDVEATEINVVEAAKASGASLYVPTQFGVAHLHPKGDYRSFSMKQAVNDTHKVA